MPPSLPLLADHAVQIELNPQGGFHTTLAMDRGINIPGQPIYMAAAYSVRPITNKQEAHSTRRDTRS